MNQPLETCHFITPPFYQDNRGYFCEVFNQKTYAECFNFHIYQVNEIFSHYGVIRGLHAQRMPFAQAKIIQVLQGTIFDIAYDARPYSQQFTQVFSSILNHYQKKQLFIPKGFFHGYAVLSASALIRYYVDAPYVPEQELNLRYDDISLDINWPIPPTKRLLSDKDLNALSWQEILKKNT